MVLSSANKPRMFQLLFSDPARTFYSSGDKLSGWVQLEAGSPCRLTGLRVTAAGCARVESRSRRQEVEYLKYEEEVRLEEVLSTGDVAAGPLGLVHQDLLGPLKYSKPASKQKKVTCMFIPDGQVSITAQIDRKGFCEGEDININAKFENTCSRIVVPKAAIIAKHSYIINSHTKVLRQKLTAVRGNPIISGMCDMWQGRTIRVPKLRPTLLGCDIIKVDYTLMVSHL
ncbi:hypothetical protein GOODEAATRI_022421 [Goodea atripinnis]|uniref:Arrestin C-terminal-like domain-containing protein n=1 Tax=Goodea atripinnis TaxID=208336 RepID=A0ABV0PGG0_9TELE